MKSLDMALLSIFQVARQSPHRRCQPFDVKGSRLVEEALKLTEASKQCGISVRTLKLLISDGLLPAARTPQGHPLIPVDAVPTWSDCRTLILQQRDRHLEKAAKLMERIEVELEAVRNDIAEAREHPTEPLGVDFSSFSFYSREQSAFGEVLSQFETARINARLYHRALTELVDADRT